MTISAVFEKWFVFHLFSCFSLSPQQTAQGRAVQSNLMLGIGREKRCEKREISQ
jgi:hypothetical protein